MTASKPVLLHFECPLTERSRTWLRLEELFSRARKLTARGDVDDHRAALVGLFDIVDTATRGDIKTDLLQELDRQKVAWTQQLGNPDVDRAALTAFLKNIESTAAKLQQQVGKVGQHLRVSDWLQSVRQRVSSPGGACAFELPMLHSWLQQPEAARRDELTAWLAPLSPLEEAVSLILSLLRDSGSTQAEHASGGNYQRALSNQRPPMLARVYVAREYQVVPEVSANKYTVNLRFLAHQGQFLSGAKTTISGQNIDFELALCSL